MHTCHHVYQIICINMAYVGQLYYIYLKRFHNLFTVKNSHCAGKLVFTCAYDNKGFDMFTIVAFDISAKITSTSVNLVIGLLTSTPPKNCTVVHFEVDRDSTLVWLFNWAKTTESILTKPSRMC